MRLSDGELRWMQARLAQRYAAAGRDAQELIRALCLTEGYDFWSGSLRCLRLTRRF